MKLSEIEAAVKQFAAWVNTFGPYEYLDSSDPKINRLDTNLIWTKFAIDEYDYIANGFFPTELGYLVTTNPVEGDPATIKIVTDYWVECSCISDDLEDCQYCEGELGIWVDVETKIDLDDIRDWDPDKFDNFFE